MHKMTYFSLRSKSKCPDWNENRTRSVALPTRCIHQVSNRYLKTCRKNSRETSKNSKRAKNNRQNSENKIFTENGTYVRKYTAGHLCTKFEGFILIYEAIIKQGKSEGFDSCDRPSYLKLESNRLFFSQCDFEIWWMISKNNRAPLLYYVKLCASFQIHRWIQTGVTVPKRWIRVEIGDILSRVTLKFDGRPWKIIGHLFYTTSSFVHHLKSISEVQFELQSGNAQCGLKLATFCPAWPWNLMDDLEKQ